MEDVVISEIKHLLEDEVLDCTIGHMRRLRNALHRIGYPSPRLVKQLLRLSSESIREALHKGELHITNGIIDRKNELLLIAGIEIPEGHESIDVNNYANYSW